MKKRNFKNLITKMLVLAFFFSFSFSNLFGSVGQMVNGAPIVTINHSNFQSKIQSDLGSIGYSNISLKSMEIAYSNSLPVLIYNVTCNSSFNESRKISVSVPLTYNSASNLFEIDDIQIMNGGRKILKCIGTNCGEGGCIINQSGDDCTLCNPPSGTDNSSCQKTNSNDGKGGSIDPWLTLLLGLVTNWINWLK